MQDMLHLFTGNGQENFTLRLLSLKSDDYLLVKWIWNNQNIAI